MVRLKRGVGGKSPTNKMGPGDEAPFEDKCRFLLNAPLKNPRFPKGPSRL